MGRGSRAKKGEKMRRKLLGLVVLSAVGVVAVTGYASAAQKTSVSGLYAVANFGTPTCAPVGASGFNLRCDTTGLVSTYTGDLVGVAVADFTSMINCKTGRETGHGTETFTGQVMNGPPGTLTWIDQFSADVDCGTFFPFNLDVNSVAVKGSGGLAGLTGKLHITDTDYSGTLH